MIDLHTHILPGVDDGVTSAEDAVEFARVAWNDGVRTVVATPHCRDGFFVNDLRAVTEGVQRLRQCLADAEVPLEVLPGAEVHLCPDLLQRIRDGRAPTLGANGTTLLLELSLSQYPMELENLLFELRLNGIEVVFAHPERIRYFQDDPRRYADLVRLGAWGQITTGSVLGTFGSTAARFSEQWLREGLVHILASDAHNTRGRPPVLSEAVAAIVPWVGPERAQAMVDAVPRALLEGRSPEVPPVERPTTRRTSLLGRWFGRESAAPGRGKEGR